MLYKWANLTHQGAFVEISADFTGEVGTALVSLEVTEYHSWGKVTEGRPGRFLAGD